MKTKSHFTLVSERDLAWLLYLFTEQFPNWDAYWKDVVLDSNYFNLNPYPVRVPEKGADAEEKKEAKLQSAFRFMQKNGLGSFCFSLFVHSAMLPHHEKSCENLASIKHMINFDNCYSKKRSCF